MDSKVQLFDALMEELEDWAIAYEITDSECNHPSYELRKDLIFTIVNLMSDNGVIDLPSTTEQDDEHYNNCMFGHNYDN